ncbi:MAG: VCBS repeat-containing protein, partial [Anaerolineae bacterium]|nr:VCBS repeat-containing protein [Anaerolineae bacterium]
MAARIFIVMAGFLLLVALPAIAQDVTVKVTPLTQSQCSGHFVPHLLSHITTVYQMPIRMYDSNGSGLALGDLNNDGLIDVVFANLDAPETILWNEGQLQFRHQELDIPGRTRGVVILDLNADGWRDIIFTAQRGAPSLWLNQRNGNFEFSALVGVSRPAYAMNWGDLDGDGDLDLVTGSYDAELSMINTNDFLFNGGAGVYYYENQGDSFTGTRLAARAQTLTILLTDMTDDFRWDIAVGNDFAELDRYWTRQSGNWVEVTPFPTITHSTMSFDAADLDNDGSWELFATDMHPYHADEATMAAWKPVMEDMMAVPMREGDPQVMTNTLQAFQAGAYRNISDILGISASGWSWSAKFGDLDSDGFRDLYIVNGMIAEDLFGHLPGNELVEENMVFNNLGGNIFTPASDWGLNSTASGRGMSMADMDGDG